MSDLFATPAAVTLATSQSSRLYGVGAFGDGSYGGPPLQSVSLGPTDIEGVSVFAVTIQGDPSWTINSRGVLPNPDDPFSYGGSQDIAATQSDPVVVMFQPTSIGTFNGTLVISYNGVGGADTLLVPLGGTGTS